MKLCIYLCFCSVLLYKTSVAQTLLQADGPGDTYELINSVLAPGFDVVEVPDCSHDIFGRHIDEVFDADLNTNVFRFYIHTTPDNDRCINFDRQRNEIKTYDKSPDDLLGVEGELVEYKWKFKLDANFQPSSSFTHLHQIKSKGSIEDVMPLITFTVRKGSPDKFELRYAEAFTQITLNEVNLTPFKGEWLEVKETILYGETGSGEYDVIISKVSDGTVLFEYFNTSIRMWKTNASFLRPKWGIYRSLNNSASLRDEEVLFADFSIKEINPVLAIDANSLPDTIINPNPFNKELNISSITLHKYEQIKIYDSRGKLVLTKELISEKVDVSFLKNGLYFIVLGGIAMPTQTIKMIKE
ncbi:MAG: T9SS type A sorting domain-containing protein [Cyclobacteriaceae bacterium]|nr:T9SS type A sorting domain-containing protein [Cyclobacteriaceae bacterium]